jgi:hypothetical protein
VLLWPARRRRRDLAPGPVRISRSRHGLLTAMPFWDVPAPASHQKIEQLVSRTDPLLLSHGPIRPWQRDEWLRANRHRRDRQAMLATNPCNHNVSAAPDCLLIPSPPTPIRSVNTRSSFRWIACNVAVRTKKAGGLARRVPAAAPLAGSSCRLAANRLDPGPHGANQINRRKRLAHEFRISGQMRRLMSRDNNDIKLGELLPSKRSQFGAEH